MAAPPTDYIAYWPMDGDLNPTGGTLQGAPGFTTGHVGSSLNLANSTGSLVQYALPTDGLLTATQIRAGWTVTAWVQDADPTTAHATSTSHKVICLCTNPITITDYIQIGTSTVYGVHGQCCHNSTLTGADWNHSAPSILSPNTWTFLAWTWNGTAMVLYQATSGAVAPATVTVATHGNRPTKSIIGADVDPADGTSAGNAYWWGLIDELRVYPYALTNQQVQDCMDYTAGTAYQASTDSDGAGYLAPVARGILRATTLR